MKFTKTMTLILSVIMLISLFVACDTEDPKVLQAQAALKLLEEPYIMTMKMNYTCDDDEINEHLEKLSSGSAISMNMDGKDFSVSMEVVGQKAEYIFAENVIYMNIAGIKTKREVDAEGAKEFIDAGAAGIEDLNVEMFTSVKTERLENGRIKISCMGFSEKTNKMIESLKKGLTAIGDSATVELDEDDVKFIIIIGKDGRYESMEMSIEIDIVTKKEKTTVKYGAEVEFDYENAKEVAAPSDADDYIDLGDLGM